MKRINVIGTSGSGKTTFARTLAEQLNLTYIELDNLYWLDDWQESSDPIFFEKIQTQIGLAPNGYVIDGNYSRSQKIKWQKVDTIIWLDLPFHLNLYRSIKRALIRSFTKQPLWANSNNKESFDKMFSRDSIILWMIKTHQKNRRKYLKLMKSNEYRHTHWIRLCSNDAIQQFLAEHHSPK